MDAVGSGERMDAFGSDQRASRRARWRRDDRQSSRPEKWRASLPRVGRMVVDFAERKEDGRTPWCKRRSEKRSRVMGRVEMLRLRRYRHLIIYNSYLSSFVGAKHDQFRYV